MKWRVLNQKATILDPKGNVLASKNKTVRGFVTPFVAKPRTVFAVKSDRLRLLTALNYIVNICT